MANFFLVLGTLLSISYSNRYLIIIGKIIYGISGGFFNVICPKMTYELAPREISGAAGTIWQVMVCAGCLFIVLIPINIIDP